jgi:RNA polymerase sigma factor (sigma-70 family)
VDLPPYFTRSKTKPLTPAELNALALKAKGGDRVAADRVILGCVRYCVSLANAWRTHPVLGRELQQDDLLAEALSGIVEAIGLWKPAKGASFLSIAATRAIWRVQNRAKRYAVSTGGTSKVSPVATRELDTPIQALREHLPDALVEHDTPEAIVSKESDRVHAQKLVRRFLFTLKDKRELAIFRHRILVEDRADQENLQTIAERFGVSREWIRQIESDLLERLAIFVGRPRLAKEIRDNLKPRAA